MRIKLSSVDTLQMAKAIRSGWLDTDKVEALRALVEGYNPSRAIGSDEFHYYLDCLYDGWGYEPTDIEEARRAMLDTLEADVLERWRQRIDDYSIYKRMVKEAFIGLVAIRALGGTFTDKEADFSFINRKPPKF